MKLDLYGRIVRTIRCQMRKYYGKRWEKVTPADFYENPERVTALWYAFREGRMPDFKHPTDFNERLMALNLGRSELSVQISMRSGSMSRAKDLGRS